MKTRTMKQFTDRGGNVMRIGIDVRYLSHGLMNGIHTYLTNLVPALVTIASADEIVLYADRKRPFELTNPPPNVTVRYLPWRTPFDSIRNDLLFSRVNARDHLDVMHFPANSGVASPPTATVVTLHDALNIFPIWEATRRDWKRPQTIGKTCYLQAQTRYALRHASMLITVSEFAKQDILAHRSMPEGQIVPIPHAPGPRFTDKTDRAQLSSVRDRHHLPEHFVLADALKNPGVLLRAWERLPQTLRDVHRIVFFSRRAEVSPEILTAMGRGEARLLIRPSEEDLAALYRLAEVFIFPSWVEGFGLPILEAMASGTPVIASDRHAVPEVAGGAALLMDAEDHLTLARHLEWILTHPEGSCHLRNLGAERAAAFSWERSASMTLSVYRTAAERNRLRVNRAHRRESIQETAPH